MATINTTTNPDSLQPGQSMMVEGYDWSWAFVVFKEILNYPGYWIGTNGTIWSFRDNSGKVKNRCREIVPSSVSKGHMKKWLTDSNVDRKMFYIHYLVLTTFLGDRPEGLVCRHKDGNPKNNNLNNLHWGTVLDNIRDRDFIHNTTARGESYPDSKLKTEQISIIYDLYENGMKVQDIARKFSIDASNCSAILRGKSWSHAVPGRRPPLLGRDGRVEFGIRRSGGKPAKPRSQRKRALTTSQVEEIRVLLNGPRISQVEIARCYGVDQSIISRIKSNIYQGGK